MFSKNSSAVELGLSVKEFKNDFGPQGKKVVNI